MKTKPWPLTPITKETFERQGWNKKIESSEETEDGEVEEFYYYELVLPKDNPDPEAPIMVSSYNDDYRDLKIKKGEFYTEIHELFGLGICTSEEEIEILYRALTKQEIE
tara:strand:- start:312 stop:638 length:327 start_codon:yes stop_codon:yes gene_type:complete